MQSEISIRERQCILKWEATEDTTFVHAWKTGTMKHVENLAAKNIAKYTGIRSGAEVKFSNLVSSVELALGVRFNYAAAAGEKQKEKDLIV